MTSSKINEWFSKASSASLWVGVILLAFSFGYSNDSSLTCSIVGYSFFEFSILLFMFSLMYKMYKYGDGGNVIINNLFTLLPFFITLGSIGYMIYMIQSYRELIISGNVSPGYYTFSNIFLVLNALQLLAFTMVTGETKNIEDSYQPIKLSQSLAFSIFSIFIILNIITIYIILTFFTTDG